MYRIYFKNRDWQNITATQKEVEGIIKKVENTMGKDNVILKNEKEEIFLAFSADQYSHIVKTEDD